MMWVWVWVVRGCLGVWVFGCGYVGLWVCMMWVCVWVVRGCLGMWSCGCGYVGVYDVGMGVGGMWGIRVCGYVGVRTCVGGCVC